jgi:hypothetical protein
MIVCHIFEVHNDHWGQPPLYQPIEGNPARLGQITLTVDFGVAYGYWEYLFFRRF